MSEGARIVETYLGHLAQHSIPEALACLTPAFQLQFGDSGFALSKNQAATALEWDAGVSGRIHWELVSEASAAVTIKGTEGNDFLDLIGVTQLPFRSTFEISADGLIARQVHNVMWGNVTLAEAMKPVIEWAHEHAPRELDAIYPGGQMIYSRPMAVRWVQLARRWKAAEV